MEKKDAVKTEVNDSTVNETVSCLPDIGKNKYGIRIPDGFEVNSMGLYYDNSGGKRNSVYICRPVQVKGLGVFNRKADESDPAMLLSFESFDGKRKLSFVVKLAEVQSRSNTAWLDRLSKRGLSIELDAFNAFRKFIIRTFNYEENRRNLCLFAAQPGWVEDYSAYVLPDRTYGGNDEYVSAIQNVNDEYSQKGTLDQWNNNAATYAEGNAPLEFALALAFGSVLMRPLGATTGTIFNLVGDSSGGKTAAQRLANSVWHKGSHYSCWYSSDNGQEANMEFFNDNLCVLDDFTQLVEEYKGDFSALVYEMANGVGKARMDAKLQRQVLKRWHTTILSSSEYGFDAAMRMKGKKATAGQGVRMPTVPVRKDMYGSLHGKKDSEDLVEWIEQQTDRYYGTAGRAFLERLTADCRRELLAVRKSGLLRKCREGLLRGHPAADTQVKRITKSFAVAMVGGILAKKFGILGFDCVNGVKAMYEEFIAARGGVENSEDREVLDAIKDDISNREPSDFGVLQKDKNGELRVPDRQKQPWWHGFAYEKDGLFFYFNDYLTKKLLPGHTTQKIKAILERAGWLVPPAKKKYSFACGNQQQVMIVKLPEAAHTEKVLEEVDPETGEVTMVSKPSAEDAAKAS